MLSLHTPQTIFSMRHVPSWLVLTFAAGMVNAAAFMACSRFVAHVSGNLTSLGMETRDVAVDYAAITGSFIVGAMTSAMLVDGRYHRKKTPLYAAPLVGVAVVLTAIGVLGLSGVFGPFGGSVDGPYDVALLASLAFAMGMQNAAVATSTGLLVRTTHMTGPATDLGVNVATALSAHGETRRVATQHAALRAGKIAAFTAGAALGVAVGLRLSYGVFFAPAALVVGATLLSFARAPRAPRQAKSARP